MSAVVGETSPECMRNEHAATLATAHAEKASATHKTR